MHQTPLATAVHPLTGNWVRFDRYEIRDSCIVPAQGATPISYDPFALPERAYQSLLEFIPSRPSSLPGKNPEMVEAALAWCNRYGLLGTLFHRVVMVTLWPRWQRLLGDETLRDLFQPQQTSYMRLPTGWARDVIGWTLSSVIDDPERLDTPLTVGEMRALANRDVEALVCRVDGSVLVREPLTKTWADYFPDTPYAERETWAYPWPGTQEFWAIYGEPTHEFLLTAWSLKNGLEALAHLEHPTAPKLGAQRLGQLAACSAASIEPQPDGTMRQRWMSFSLLSALALMAMTDLSRGALHQCETCHTFFLNDAYQVRYCSDRCRQTMQKRRQRDKQRRKTRRRERRQDDGQKTR